MITGRADADDDTIRNFIEKYKSIDTPDQNV